MENTPCFKCNGSGKIGAFSHVASGVCFQCSGSGVLTIKPAAGFVHRFPVVAEADRSTSKQWAFLGRLAGDSDDKARKWIIAAGAPCANQLYVSKAVMSRAIEIGKGA